MAGELKLNNVSVATESGGVVTVNNSVLHNAITMADTAMHFLKSLFI